MKQNHNTSGESVMAFRPMTSHHKRPSLLCSYHGHISSSPERHNCGLNSNHHGSFVNPIKLGPHADDQAKRSQVHSISVSSALIAKRNCESIYSSSLSLTSDEVKSNEDLQTLKDSLLGKLQKYDTYINSLAYSLEKLKKNQSNIEHRLLKPKNECGESAKQKPMPVIEAVMAENQLKVKAVHTLFGKCGFDPKSTGENLVIPLYQEPSDTEIYHRNKESFGNAMRDRLKVVLKKQSRNYNTRVTYLSKKYDKLYEDWCSKVSEIENSPEYISKQLKFQEVFEETFPQLRQMREEKEQLLKCENHKEPDDSTNLCTCSCASVFQEFQEEENLMRRLAIEPPMLLDEYRRRCVFVNNNGLIRNFESRSRIHEILRQWSDEEKKIFQEKYLQFPKNFGVIASFHERKTIQDCIEYYYLTKKKVDYKGLLKKQHGKRKPKSAIAVSSNKSCKEIRLDPEVGISSNCTEKQSENATENGTAAPESQRHSSVEKRQKRCMILSCTTVKAKIKKLQKFPVSWFEIEDSLRQEISEHLQIPADVTQCCRRCYDRISSRIKERSKDTGAVEESDDDESASASDETELTSKDGMDAAAEMETEDTECNTKLVPSVKCEDEDSIEKESLPVITAETPHVDSESSATITTSSYSLHDAASPVIEVNVPSSDIREIVTPSAASLMTSVSEYGSTSCAATVVTSAKVSSAGSFSSSDNLFSTQTTSHSSSFQHSSQCGTPVFQPSIQNNSVFYPSLNSNVPSYFSVGSEPMNNFYRALSGAPIMPPFLLSDRFTKLDPKVRHSFLPHIFAPSGFSNFLPGDLSVNADSSLERSRQTLVSDYLTSMSMNNGMPLHVPDTSRCPQSMKPADMRPFFMPSQKVAFLDSFQRYRSPCGISPFFEYRESYPYMKTVVDEQFSRADILNSPQFTIPITESYPLMSRTRSSNEEILGNKKKMRLDGNGESKSTSSENQNQSSTNKSHRSSLSSSQEKPLSVSPVTTTCPPAVETCPTEPTDHHNRPTPPGNHDNLLSEQEHESKLKQLLNRPPPDYPLTLDMDAKNAAVQRQRSYTVGSTDCRSIKKMQVIEKMSEFSKRLVDEESRCDLNDSEGPRKRVNSITKQLLTGQLPNNTVYRELNDTLKYYGSVDMNKLKLGNDNPANSVHKQSSKNTLNSPTASCTETERPQSAENKSDSSGSTASSYQCMKKRLLQEYEKEHE